MVKYIQQKQQRQQHKNLLWQFIQLCIPIMGLCLRMLRGQRDLKAHNIPGQRDVELNELANEILMLLPLLLLLLLLLYVLYNVLIQARFAPPYI